MNPKAGGGKEEGERTGKQSLMKAAEHVRRVSGGGELERRDEEGSQASVLNAESQHK